MTASFYLENIFKVMAACTVFLNSPWCPLSADLPTPILFQPVMGVTLDTFGICFGFDFPWRDEGFCQPIGIND